MDGTTILISVLGGVTLLLWGCRMIRTGVMRAFGRDLQQFLGGGSADRWRSVLAGTAVGAALQSSTAMALLVSPFVSHGAIAMPVALAIMLGADLGSAVAAGVFSTGISVAWPVLAFAGYVLHATYEGRSNRVQNTGDCARSDRRPGIFPPARSFRRSSKRPPANRCLPFLPAP
jgi:phosphate:Na+ symporter